jgi:hypothetical protein
MPLDSTKYAPLVKKAVAHYWKTLLQQSSKQKKGNADRGGRAAVTGGKQMDGFCEVVHEVLVDSGLPNAHIFLDQKLELPGYFRPTKSWDMLVVSDGRLVAAMEFKSQRGPSFGNNFNNRSEEAIGTAKDLWIAYREGAFGKDSLRPWLGWVMLLEDCPKSTSPVKVDEPHFKVFPEFKGASYAKRYEILIQKLVKERMYDGAAFLMATEKGGPKGVFAEPANDITMRTFLAGLAGHIGVHLASRRNK